ncbi:MAG TPA: CotS family spore coat protein [Clostridiaceae bacterium]|nr:CotS family spore coat protein [Clostridiaceae bacterium]
MQNIDKEISDKFRFNITNIIPFKDAYIINTSEGKKLLRKSRLRPDRIVFVHGAKEHLYRNNFKNLDRYLCTTDNNPYIYINDSYYTVTNFIEGRECNFENREDTISAARLLASFHNASKGYIAPADCKEANELGKLPSLFNKRLNELKRLKKIAKKARSKFDYLYLEWVDYFLNIGGNVLEQLNGSSSYKILVNRAREEKVLCHHDFTHRNIIISENKVNLVNFEYCCYEIKAYDIANFLRRKMRKCNWNFDDAKLILDEYRNVEEISDDEFFIIKLMLLFPQKFWRVANRYYNSRRSWSERIFISKLQEVVDEAAFHEQFMKRYDELR